MLQTNYSSMLQYFCRIENISSFFFFFFFFFFGCTPHHAEVPVAGTEPMPQQEHQFLNPLRHQETPRISFFSLFLFWVVFFCCCFVFLSFFKPHPRYTEVPRLGVESELQLPTYTTATATQDLSYVCNLHHSS